MKSPAPLFLALLLALLLTLTAGCSGGGGGKDDGPTGVISAIDPPYAARGVTVTVTGSLFGSTPGTITFGGVTATASGWTDGAITAVVPPLDLGSVSVVVTTKGGDSDPFAFEVALPPRLYVNDGLGFVEVFAVATNGALSALSGSPFSTGFAGASGHGGDAHALAIDTDVGKLYASGTTGISAFDIDLETGALDLLPTLVIGTGNLPVALTPDRTHLLVAECQGTSYVGSVAVDSAGGMTAGDIVPTDGCLDAMVISHDGSFAVVNDENDNELHVFDIAANGDLTEVVGSPFAVLPGYSLQIHPTQNWLYRASGAEIEGWELGAGGTLTPLPGSTFAYPSNSGAGLAFTRDGARLYVSGFGSTDVQEFTVSTMTGELTPGPVTPTGIASAGQVATTSREGFLMIGGQDAELAVLAIGSSGALTAVTNSPFALQVNANPVGLIATP